MLFLEEYNKLDELPFDYNRKYVSVLCENTLNEKSNLNNENLFELVLNVDDGFIKIKFEDVIIECLKRDWA